MSQKSYFFVNPGRCFSYKGENYKTMRKLLRITYGEADYTYEIVNESPINRNTTELQVMVEGAKYVLVKDSKQVWVQKEGEAVVDPNVLHAIGRTIFSRFRMC